MIISTWYIWEIRSAAHLCCPPEQDFLHMPLPYLCWKASVTIFLYGKIERTPKGIPQRRFHVPRLILSTILRVGVHLPNTEFVCGAVLPHGLLLSISLTVPENLYVLKEAILVWPLFFMVLWSRNLFLQNALHSQHVKSHIYELYRCMYQIALPVNCFHSGASRQRLGALPRWLLFAGIIPRTAICPDTIIHIDPGIAGAQGQFSHFMNTLDAKAKPMGKTLIWQFSPFTWLQRNNRGILSAPYIWNV